MGDEPGRDDKAGAADRRLDGPRAIWPHQGLVASVVPSGNRQGLPVGGRPYVWRKADRMREWEIQAHLDELRATICPGEVCRRLSDGMCREVCAPHDEPPTVPLLAG